MVQDLEVCHVAVAVVLLTDSTEAWFWWCPQPLRWPFLFVTEYIALSTFRTAVPCTADVQTGGGAAMVHRLVQRREEEEQGTGMGGCGVGGGGGEGVVSDLSAGGGGQAGS